MKENKKRADYAERPLTEEERVFASASENYNKLFKYMRQNRLDQEEWYDILIIPYLDAVKKYCSRPELHVYSFGAIVYKKLSCAYHHYWRSYNSQTNMPMGGIVSLDQTLQGDNSFAEYAIEEWLEDKTNNIEQKAIDSITLLKIAEELSELQKTIFIMLIEEYNMANIRRKIGMDHKTMEKEVEVIRAVVKNYLF